MVGYDKPLNTKWVVSALATSPHQMNACSLPTVQFFGSLFQTRTALQLSTFSKWFIKIQGSRHVLSRVIMRQSVLKRFILLRYWIGRHPTKTTESFPCFQNDLDWFGVRKRHSQPRARSLEHRNFAEIDGHYNGEAMVPKCENDIAANPFLCTQTASC